MGDNSSIFPSKFWYCPLYSYGCECGSVDLFEEIQIEPAPPDLKSYISNHYMSAGQWDDPSVFDWVALLPYESKVTPKDVTNSTKSIFEEIDKKIRLLEDLITALRLCHRGSVVPGVLTCSGIQIWPSLSRNGWSGEPKYELSFWSDVHEINKTLEEIRSYRAKDKRGALDETLSRFNSSYYGTLEDRLVDQMIAFESLYLGDPQELTYKLALRTAFFLGQGTRERKVIFADIKKAYSYRSRIVHGDSPPSTDELRGIVHKTEEYLRQSIRRFISLLFQGKSLKEFRDKLLDENIIKNGRLLALRE